MRMFLLFLALLVPAASYADDSKSGTLTVHGEATTKILPDQATIPVTLTTENQNLTAAKQESDKKLKNLVAIAQSFGVAKDDMQTEYNNVQPKYDYGQNVTTETSIYTGYINFGFDVKALAQDKIDEFTEALQKAGLGNISNSHAANMVRINANFNDRNEDAKALHELLKKKEDEVLALAVAAGIDKNRITRNSTENKGKESRSNTPKPHIGGYQATVNVNFIVKDKEKVTPLINAIVKEGVDNIGSVSFSLSTLGEKKTREETLLKALQDASEKAHKLAQAAGSTIDRPLSIDEGSGDVRPPVYPRPVFNRMMKAAAMSEDAAGGAEMPSGQIEIHQIVTVTYALK